MRMFGGGIETASGNKTRRLLLLRGDSEGVVSVWVVPETPPTTPAPQRPPG